MFLTRCQKKFIVFFFIYGPPPLTLGNKKNWKISKIKQIFSEKEIWGFAGPLPHRADFPPKKWPPFRKKKRSKKIRHSLQIICSC